jgi:hypothetical protein
MDAKTGTEKIITGLIMPNLRPMFEDMMRAAKDADLLITGEIVYPAKSVVEKTGVKWISTSLAPISFLSAEDPPLPPVAEWYKYLRFMPTSFHRGVFNVMRGTIRHWYDPYKRFRRELGLDENHDPIFDDNFRKFSACRNPTGIRRLCRPGFVSMTAKTISEKCPRN